MSRGNPRYMPPEILEHAIRAYTVYLRGLPEIGSEIGWAPWVIRRRLVAAGVRIRTRGEATRIYKGEGRGISHEGGKYERTPEIRAKLSASRKALPARGLSLKPSGYLEITRGPDKHRGQHRVEMEKILGRRLGRREVVHHKDHDRSNNAIENLEIMTLSQHARLHIMERIRAGENMAAHFKARGGS